MDYATGLQWLKRSQNGKKQFLDQTFPLQHSKAEDLEILNDREDTAEWVE